MLIEFVGLPGSGKTTLGNLLMQKMASENISMLRLRDACQTTMRSLDKKIRCIRNRPDRVNLYGLSIFARNSPELLQISLQNVHGRFDEAVWFMEMMSQMGIVQEHAAQDLIVFTDEGFMQRTSAAFRNNPEVPELAETVALLPPSITIALNGPPSVMIDRAKSRPKGIPSPMRSSNKNKQLTNFELFQKSMENVIQERKRLGAKGSFVLELDATSHPESIAESAFDALAPYL